VLPVLDSGPTAGLATAFLAEFLSDGSVSALSTLTRVPLTEPLGLTRFSADIHRPAFSLTPSPLVLVHGLSAQGKDDPRLRQAAQLLARAGFAVAVPTIPGLTQLRLRPEDAEPVVAAIQVLGSRSGGRRVAVVGVSVGAGPALLAAADPRVADRVGLVLSLGGYASTVELLRHFLTGQSGFGPVTERAAPNPEGARLLLRANLDLLEDPRDRARLSAWLDAAGGAPPGALSRAGAAVVELLENRDPARVGPLIEALPPALRTLLERLSPEQVLPRLRGRLVLVHGRNDPAVPYTESLRLAEAARRAGIPLRLVVVGVVAHVEAAELPAGALWQRTRDLAKLWATTFDLFRSR